LTSVKVMLILINRMKNVNTIFVNANPGNIIWLQYIIELGLRGNHPLFENDEIRRAFDKDIDELTQMEPETINEINTAIKNILQATDMETQRNLIVALSPQTRDLLVHLYFQMIDQNMTGGNPTKH